MTTTTDIDPIAAFVSNLVDQENRYCRLEWDHGSHCPGFEIHGYQMSPEEHDYEECDALACDSLRADLWIRSGETSSGSLCAEHLVTWLEHEVDTSCDGCVTMFKSIEGSE